MYKGYFDGIHYHCPLSTLSPVRCQLRCIGNLPVTVLSYPDSFSGRGVTSWTTPLSVNGTWMGQSHTALLFIFLRQGLTLWPRLSQSLLQPPECSRCHRYVLLELATDSLCQLLWYGLNSCTSLIFQEKIRFLVRVFLGMWRQVEQIWIQPLPVRSPANMQAITIL